MPDRRFRVLLVYSHPIQYSVPVLRQMAKHPRLDIQVAYCSMHGVEPGLDPEFGVEVKWDVPLLDGYPWVYVRNRSPRPVLLRFFGLINPGLWKLVRTGHYDAVFFLTGYYYLSFWIVAAAARLSGVPLLGGSDAYNLGGADPKWWKSLVKRFCLPLVYRVYRVVVVSSNSTRQFVASLGMPRERIISIRDGFDVGWWAREADRSDRRETRARWGVSADSPVILFCAKLTPRKRPQDVLRAFARTVDGTDCSLIFAGDGPMRNELEAEARALGVSGRVVFCGFVNQSHLPALFRASDLFVLSSEWDGGPLVVGETMSCGCPVVLSDAIPGRFELVRHGETGFIYPCGNVDALASILRQALPDAALLKKLSTSASELIKTWSIPAFVEAFVNIISQLVGTRGAHVDEQQSWDRTTA